MIYAWRDIVSNIFQKSGQKIAVCEKNVLILQSKILRNNKKFS